MSPAAGLQKERARTSGAGFRHQGQILWRDFPQIAQGVRQWLDAEGVRAAHRRKVFSTFVEMTYNVLHHAAPGPRDPLAVMSGRTVMATVALASEGPEIWVATENLIKPEQVAGLAERLSRLAVLGPDEVRALYRERVTAGSALPGPPPGNNAGLGLLTIARDAARPLQYSLAPGRAPGDLTTFSLRAYV